MMNRIFLLVAVIAISISSCKRKKIASSNQLPSEIIENDFTFSSFSAKAKAEYAGDGQNFSAPIQIKIMKDSAIMVTVTPMGLEMARVLIRKDSIFVKNRLKKEYFKDSFDFLQNYFGMKVDYNLVERMIVGNIPLHNVENQKLTENPTHYILSQLFNDFEITNSIKKEYKRLDNLNIKGKNNFTSNIVYSNFETIQEVKFAKNINLVTEQGAKKSTINVKFSKIKLSNDPISLSFSIPKSYERIKMQ